MTQRNATQRNATQQELVISIIIPIYNTAKYLPRCIDSVLAQTYSSLDIILVNDGSTDNSLDICNQYAALDARIRVLSQENKGVSAARNLGLDNAKGEYILFIDSDDYVLTDHVSSLLFPLIETNSDISVSKMLLVYSEDEIPVKNENLFTYSYNTQGVRQSLIDSVLTKKFCGGIGGKLYKSKYLKNIRFDENKKIGEDWLFFYDALMLASYICVVDDVTYIYIHRMGSTMNIVHSGKYEDYLKSVSDIVVFFENKYPDLKWCGDFMNLSIRIDFHMHHFTLDKNNNEYKYKVDKLENFRFLLKTIFNKNFSFKSRVKFLSYLISPKLFFYLKKLLINTKV